MIYAFNHYIQCKLVQAVNLALRKSPVRIMVRVPVILAEFLCGFSQHLKVNAAMVP
jgi:hypothetical protein